MSFTAAFLMTAVLSPLLAGSTLIRIILRGPQAAGRGFLMPAAVLASLAASVIAFLADPHLPKLVVLSASGLPTLVLLFVSMVFVTFPEEFSDETP